MKFCPDCKSLILPKKNDQGGSIYECKCGYSEVGGDTKLSSSTNSKEVKDIEMPVDTDNTLPICKEDCEECGNKEAYWWEIQTRAGDEPATRFFKCTKCKKTWRDYS